MKTALTEMAGGLNAPFMRQKILEFGKLNLEAYKAFITQEDWFERASIEVQKIVGTKHPSYIGMTWLEFLQKGRRMKLNHQLFDQTPEYYLTEEMKWPKMSFIEVDGQFYVDDDGNHRSCIAKFYFEKLGRKQLHGVEVRRYKVKWNALKAYSRLSKRLESMGKVVVKLNRELIRREDGPGWKEDYFRSVLSLTNRCSGQCMEFSLDDCIWLNNQIETASWMIRRFPRDPVDRLLLK